MPDDKERREEGPEGGPEERLHEFIRERFPSRKPPWEEEATEPEAGSDSDDEEEPNGEDEEHRTSNEEPDRAGDEA